VQLRLGVTKDEYVAQYRPDAKGGVPDGHPGKLAPGKDEQVSLQCYNGPAKANTGCASGTSKFSSYPNRPEGAAAAATSRTGPVDEERDTVFGTSPGPRCCISRGDSPAEAFSYPPKGFAWRYDVNGVLKRLLHPPDPLERVWRGRPFPPHSGRGAVPGAGSLPPALCDSPPTGRVPRRRP
jgi:hypothetical protein